MDENNWIKYCHICPWAEKIIDKNKLNSLKTIPEINLNNDSNLRLARKKFLAELIWADFILGLDSTDCMKAWSEFAEQCLLIEKDKIYLDLIEKNNKPDGDFYIIALGKFGGYELNYSSDIDLLFCYSGTMESQLFYSLLAQKLIKNIDSMTPDGFVFRIDMRLRPLGEAGPIVMSFNGLENYYQQQGRDWERYAMVKARILGAETIETRKLNLIFKKFVYRKYIDYGIVDSLRQLKNLMDREGQFAQNDIKRGPGGIREIEFIAQTFQIIRGGQSPNLQSNNLLMTLDNLVKSKCLKKKIVKILKEAYLFFRNVEHLIQIHQDQQSHCLPSDEAGQERLAMGMGFDNYDKFLRKLDDYRKEVVKHFSNMIAPSYKKNKILEKPNSDLEDFWLGGEINLEKFGFDDGSQMVNLRNRLWALRNKPNIDAISKKRLDGFMPLLFNLLCELDCQASVVLNRISDLIENILRRSAYLVLLTENPDALILLIKLFYGSPWVAKECSQYPILLDELLTQEFDFSEFNFDGLKNILFQSLLGCASDDLESQMDVLRRFKHSLVLRVAAAQLSNQTSADRASYYLSLIASVIVAVVQQIVYSQLSAKYGEPSEPLFGILAYGKLGSQELSYSSDLDLVFIFNGKFDDETNGENNLTYREFYTRLYQRIIHVLSTVTAMGRLYEIDVRLRPSGESGLLVTSMEHYDEYQINKAWTWEHQALVKTRLITRDELSHERLLPELLKIKKSVLGKKREENILIVEVKNMREKMREVNKKNIKNIANSFDLKQGVGGLVDIEFLTQYWVLLYSGEDKSLAEVQNTKDILVKLLDKKIITKSDYTILEKAIDFYQENILTQSLQEQPAVIDYDKTVGHPPSVRAIWERVFGSSQID